MSASPNLKLPYIDANQNQKSVTHNAALTILDALVNCQVRSAALSAPPASPGDGQCWIVASGGSGAWTGKDFNIAAWQDGAWTFYPPTTGMLAYNDATGGPIVWTGTAWAPLSGGGGGGGAVTSVAGRTGTVTLAVADVSGAAPLASPALTGTPTAPTQTAGDSSTKLATTGFVAASFLLASNAPALGIGTAADPGNPLSAKLNSALFAALPATAAGTGDLRFTLSKQAAGNTASFLFQDNFSGRAEIGLTGDDNFHFKVSADGATWFDALDIAASTGTVSFLGTPTFPTAVAGDNSTKGATTAWVTGKGYVTAAGAAAAAPVQSVAGRTGAVMLAVADVSGAASSAALAAAFARTQVNDANYAVAATDRTVAVIALTAARTLTLPAASAYPQGATLTIVDESGACSATNVITILRAGTDTINGAASATLGTAYCYLALQSNGANKWTVVDQVPAAPRLLFAGNTGGTNNSATNAGTFVSHGLSYSIPANFLTSGRVLRVTAHFTWSTGTVPADLQERITLGGTPVYLADLGTPSASLSSRQYAHTYLIQATAAPGAAVNVLTAMSGNTNAISATTTGSVAQPVALATNAALAIDFQTEWASAGTGPNTIQLLQLVAEALN